MLGPVEEGATRALKPARDLVNWFDETFDARGENDDLEAEVQELRAELADAPGGRRRERAVPRSCSSSDKQSATVAAYEKVTAGSSGARPTVWYSTVTIDVGSELEGVEVDDPV